MPRPAKAPADAPARTHVRIPAAVAADVAALLDIAHADRTPTERRLLDPAYMADLLERAIRRELAAARRKASDVTAVE